MLIDRELFSPNAFWLWKYTLDPSVRFIVLYGGSSSGKSYSVAQFFAILAYYEECSMLVMRKVGASIEKTIYADFKAAINNIEGLAECCRFKQNSIVFNNGGKIDFSGLDDPEKIKGISQYKRVFLDELSEYDETDFKQIRLRLRGQEGQQIVAAFNPISEEHWIKKHWFDREEWHEIPMSLTVGGETLPPELCAVKSVRMNSEKLILNPNTGEYDRHAPDTIVIQSTYLNNFWVVGSPDGTYGYYDYQAIANFENDRINDPDYYQVYALGEWGHIRTGAEFFPSFNRGVVCGKFPFNPELPIHISMDSNVLPYVTATFFQKEYKPDDYQQVTQIDELPIESPNNSARKAAKVIAKRLREYNYTEKVYLHGDASGKAANTIDSENRSFFDLVIDELEKEGFDVVDNIGSKNPSVATTGEFINAVWDGRVPNVAIRIDNDCSVSIDDYQAVQKDENGAIAKTKVTNPVTKQKYEAHGHITDTLRYAVHDLLRQQYTEFSMGRKRSLYSESEFNFFNPATSYEYERTVVYVIPSIGGLFVLGRVSRIGDRWHLTDVCRREVKGNEEIEAAVRALSAEQYMVECQPAYFPMVRNLRKELGNVNVLKMTPDIRTRITAMSDWVRAHVHIDPERMNEPEYGQFINDVLDYSDTSAVETVGASAVLSGLARIIVRNGM
jgi:PBSX family phage terminase large subunit